MSQTLGIPGDIGYPEVAKHVDRALEVCGKKNIPCGVPTYDNDTAKKWIGRGCRFTCLGGDTPWLQDAMQAAYNVVMGGVKKQRGPDHTESSQTSGQVRRKQPLTRSFFCTALSPCGGAGWRQ